MENKNNQVLCNLPLSLYSKSRSPESIALSYWPGEKRSMKDSFIKLLRNGLTYLLIEEKVHIHQPVENQPQEGNHKHSLILTGNVTHKKTLSDMESKTMSPKETPCTDCKVSGQNYRDAERNRKN